MMKSPENVLLVIPCGADEGLSVDTTRGLLNATLSERNIFAQLSPLSLLAYNFNTLWAMALNSRVDGSPAGAINRFVMLHSDIGPIQNDWIDILLDLLNETEADLLSVVVPIKDFRGLSSTALDTDPWRPRRLTMAEVHGLPETFGNSDITSSEKFDLGGNLLVNTGLMAIRFDAKWIQSFHFEIQDRITLVDGKYEARVQPEDWQMSRWFHEHHLKVMATTKIKATHTGDAPFNNCGVWGSYDHDKENIPRRI